MTRRNSFFLFIISYLIYSPGALAELNGWVETELCASSKEADRVRAFYEEFVGAPTPIPGRRLDMPEARVVTALPAENSIGALTTPEQVKDIWTTIDEWGEETFVHLVFTMGGQHVYDFPSLVPVRQEDLQDGWLDIYADNGDGVHGHLWLEPIRSVHAIDIPGPDDDRTRAINFYTLDGNLAIGVYASISTKDFDQAAVDGFAKTREFIASLPKACD